MDRQEKSQIVDELIKSHLPRHVVQVRSGGDEVAV